MIGPSLGGMTVLAYRRAVSRRHVDNLISISGAASASPFAIALRSLQREIVRSDPAWRGGNYEPGRGPRQGLRLARKLGTITYRGRGVGAALRPPARRRRRPGIARRLPPAVRSRGVPRAPGAALRRRSSTRTPTCTSRAHRTSSTWPSTATGSLAGGVREIPAIEAHARDRRAADMLYTIDQQQRDRRAVARGGTRRRIPRVPVAAGPRLVPGRLRAFRAGDRQFPEVDLVASD